MIDIKALTLYCSNCSAKLVIYRDDKGTYSCFCPVCGVRVKVRSMTRRCIVTEFHAPKGSNFY